MIKKLPEYVKSRENDTCWYDRKKINELVDAVNRQDTLIKSLINDCGLQGFNKRLEKLERHKHEIITLEWKLGTDYPLNIEERRTSEPIVEGIDRTSSDTTCNAQYPCPTCKDKRILNVKSGKPPID